MARVVIELYSGRTANFDNARYGVRGDKYVVTRNGRTVVQIDRVHVYDIALDSGGSIPSADNPGTGNPTLRGNAQAS